MSCQQQLDEWTTIIHTHLPRLSQPQATVLALWSLGMVLARSCALTAVSLFLATWLCRKDQTVRQQGVSHPFSLARALYYSASLHHLCREEQAAQAQAAVALTTEHGFTFWLSRVTVMRGWALAAQGQTTEGLACLHQGIADFQSTGSVLGLPYFQALLAEAYGHADQAEEGLAVLAEALAAVDHTRECYYAAELYRLKGELLLARSMEQQCEAATCFRHALDLARRQQAKALELR